MPLTRPRMGQGRKYDAKMAEWLRLELNVDLKDPNDKAAKAKKYRAGRLIARALVRASINGDVQAIKEVFNRMDGAVTQKIGGDPEAPLITSELLASTTAALTDAELEICERFLSRIAAQQRVTPRHLNGPVVDDDPS